MDKALFLDRDGTLIEDVNYLSDLSQIKLIPKVIKHCKDFQDLGYKLFVVTNQSGVARGYFDEAFVSQTHKFLAKLLFQEGLSIQAFYYCPHHPDYTGDCDCRKPKPGMLIEAAKAFKLDLSSSIMIGDKDIDVVCGKSAGAQGFLVHDMGIVLERVKEL